MTRMLLLTRSGREEEAVMFVPDDYDEARAERIAADALGFPVDVEQEVAVLSTSEPDGDVPEEFLLWRPYVGGLPPLEATGR